VGDVVSVLKQNLSQYSSEVSDVRKQLMKEPTFKSVKEDNLAKEVILEEENDEEDLDLIKENKTINDTRL